MKLCPKVVKMLSKMYKNHEKRERLNAPESNHNKQEKTRVVRAKCVTLLHVVGVKEEIVICNRVIRKILGN